MHFHMTALFGLIPAAFGIYLVILSLCKRHSIRSRSAKMTEYARAKVVGIRREEKNGLRMAYGVYEYRDMTGNLVRSVSNVDRVDDSGMMGAVREIRYDPDNPERFTDTGDEAYGLKMLRRFFTAGAVIAAAGLGIACLICR